MGNNPLVAVVMGSETDRPIADKTASILDKLEIPYEVKVLSAHRNPEELEKYIDESKAKVFIGIAGMAAHLPGFIASRTPRPVIGVPVSGKLGGLDALLSIVQMPRGVPVGCVAVDGGENAALLAARILAVGNKELERRVAAFHP